MGSFFSNLGQGLTNAGANLVNPAQYKPNSGTPLGLIMNPIQAYRAAQKAKAMRVGPPNMQPTDPSQGNQYPTMPSDEDQGDGMPAMAPQYDSMPSDEGAEPMAAGKIVTQPTTAILGESGPEAVLPLNSSPHNKTSAALLDQPGNALGTTMGSGVRTRYRHPTGPVAAGRMKPLSADLPLRPNNAQR